MGISLRLLMALTIAVVAVVSATVCFAPTYVAGVKSVTGTVDNIRKSLVTLAAERLTAYFAKPRDLALQLQFISERGRLDANNATAMLQLSCDLAIANMHSFQAINLLMINEQVLARCDTSNNITGINGGVTTLITLSADKTLVQGFAVDPVTHLPIPSMKNFETPYPVGTPLWAIFPVSVVFGLNPTISTTWAPPAIAWDATSLTVGSRLTDPTGAYRGAIMFDVNSNLVSVFLQSLGMRSGGRAIAWDDGTGFAIGLSWNEKPVSLYPTWQDLSLPDSARGALRPLDNFTDPLLRRVLSGLGGLAALRALPLPFASELGSGRDLVYVDVVGVRDQYSLNVKILIAMPQIDFLRDVYQQQVRTLAGVCVGVVAMIGVAFLIGRLMAAPLQRLAERMELTASFADNEEDDPPSLLEEAASMQASYSLMKQQLNRAKTYLPQSVLARTEEDDDEEEEKEGGADNRESVQRASEGRRSVLSASASRSDVATSRSSRGRRQTHVSSNGGTAANGLNLELGLSFRFVSIVAFNLQGFMRCAVSSARRCAEVQETMLTALQRIVRENKGVVDYFQGDHVLASFNAVTNTVSHGRRALVAALTTIRELRGLVTMPLHATAGISSGTALCGNMGTKEMRRFCIVGNAVGQAMTLERLTKRYTGVSALMPGWMEADATLDMYYQAVDIARLPGGGPKIDPSENRSTCILMAPTAVKAVTQDEWMYELKSGDDANPFKHVNTGFRALLSGDLPAAKAAIAARPPSDVDAVGAASLQAYLDRVGTSLDGKISPTDFGAYYNDCVLRRSTADTTGST